MSKRHRQKHFWFDDPHNVPLDSEREIIVDCFAGGGGASVGIERGCGIAPDIAINHDPEAVAMHQANHPQTKHYEENLWDVDPAEVCEGRKVGLAWFSPEGGSVMFWLYRLWVWLTGGGWCSRCQTVFHKEDSPLGADFNLCQDCWEAECSESWWGMFS